MEIYFLCQGQAARHRRIEKGGDLLQFYVLSIQQDNLCIFNKRNNGFNQ